MLSFKQGGIKYHFLSFWYDLTWDWTQVSQGIGKHSNHNTNGPVEQTNNNDSLQTPPPSSYYS